MRRISRWITEHRFSLTLGETEVSGKEVLSKPALKYFCIMAGTKMNSFEPIRNTAGKAGVKVFAISFVDGKTLRSLM